MPLPPRHDESRTAGVEVHLLGVVDFGACLALQQRLVYEASGSRDGRITLLLAEHPPLITVGRQGSWGHLHWGRFDRALDQLPVRWLSRGGGCLVHAPGQLAVYPIVPLAWHGFSVGDYLDRLQTGVVAALAELRLGGLTRPGRHGVWGRNGQWVTFGVAIRNWVSYHGLFVNVAPSLRLLRLADSDPREHTPASSLSAERREPVKMTRVREGLVRHLPAALGAPRCHVFTGHPLLQHAASADPEPAARAG